MITQDLALELKEAGLVWQPRLHDFFAIPDTDLADRLFVVSDMTVDVKQLLGSETITFNGAVEWSLDYILKADVVWMPTETQLRQALQGQLMKERQPAVRLFSSPDRYRCQIQYLGNTLSFEEEEAGLVYGLALLYILRQGTMNGTSTNGQRS